MLRDLPTLESALAEAGRKQLRRSRLTVDSFVDAGSGVRIRSAGRTLLNFASNDYLGLARHPAMAAAMAASALADGSGSGAAHLVTGHGREHAALEAEVASFVGRTKALLFSTGYMANLAVITAFSGRGERVLLDRLDHASLIDGALLSGARFKRYAHADTEALSNELAAGAGAASLVATDGVFSMDGDIAPLPRIAALCREYRAWLVVDDAHGLGVLGNNGRGVLEAFGLDEDAVPLLVGTFGKAFGSFGAFVAGPQVVIDTLIQTARPYIYTTALPQPVAAATRAALRIAAEEGWRRTRVLGLTQRFRSGCEREGIRLTPSATPIQPVILGSAAAALQIHEALFANGLWVSAIRPPTVPAGTSRLRVTLSAAHAEAEVDLLVAALAEAVHAAAAS